VATWVLRAGLLTALLLVAFACNGGGDSSDSNSTPGPSASETPRPNVLSTPVREKGWQELAPMPTPRYGAAVVELNSQIYVIGGIEADGSSSTKVEVYDPIQDSWSNITPLPKPRHHAAAYALVGLFVVGGYEEGFDDPKDTILQYDPATSAWTELPPLPHPRAAHVVAVDIPCGEAFPPVACIYAIGGVDADGKNVQSVALNESTGAWRDVAPLPTPRDRLAVALSLGLIYAIGGRSETDAARNLDANEYYNPEEDTWEAARPLPAPRSGIAAATVGARIYVFGGEDEDDVFDTVEAYDVSTSSWEELDPMPTARHSVGAAVVGESIYVIGGGTEPGGSASDANEVFTP
jgi:N-acetylneuraminic acid mutarotase